MPTLNVIPVQKNARTDAPEVKHVHVVNPSQVADFSERKNIDGRKAWSLLHSYRGCDPQWVELWEHFIPQAGGCGCKENYKAILKEFPPDYTDADSFWRWGWFLHNTVNEKLGKPLIDLEEARRIWNRPEPTE